MKIAILGTRGVPNQYGGFEQFAEYLSVGLTKKGHSVFVYNSHSHSYQESTWNGVNIVHKYDPENKLGTVGQFIYDFNCIIDSRKRNFDVILQLGYTSSSIWGNFLPGKSVIVTNMDGLEWKRTKYNKYVQKFLLYAEKLAVKTSDVLIADSIGIQDYLNDKYKGSLKRPTYYIPYGANIFNNPNPEILKNYTLHPYRYNILIARMEPENSIEIILDGVVSSRSELPILVFGNHTGPYGEFLKNKFKNEKRIVFMGPLYNIDVLNDLRYFSNLYFHGHTVGGTNPSLLESMSSGAVICAHENSFNQYILGKDAFYFKTSDDVAKYLNEFQRDGNHPFVEENLQKIKNLYSWEKIINEYEYYLLEAKKLNMK